MNVLQTFGIAVLGQVTVVTFAAIILMSLARRSAAQRDSIGVLALALVLLSPFLASVLPQAAWFRPELKVPSGPESAQTRLEAIEPSSKPRAWNPRESNRPAPEVSVVAPGDVAKTPVAPPGVSSPHPEAIPTGQPSDLKSEIPIESTSGIWWHGVLNLTAVVWLAGSVFLAIKWIWQCWRLRRLVRSLSISWDANSKVYDTVCDEVRSALKLRDLPPVAVSNLIPTPMVVGMWRPLIVLPRDLLQPGSERRLHDVLIHECAHVSRRDPWVNAAQRLAAVLWWWHPGILWLNRLIARSREEVCDNFVLRNGDAPSYAETLLDLAESCSLRRRFVPALELLGTHWSLEQRISGILNPQRNTMTSTTRGTVILTAAGFALLCLLAGGVRGVDQPPDLAGAPTESTKTEASQPAERKPTATRPLVIRGTCLDDNTKTLANVQVRVFRNPGASGPVSLIAETKSDRHGKFEFRDIKTETIDREELIVAGTATQYVSAITTAKHNDAGIVDLELNLSTNPGALTGIVKDQEGQPIKGVTVFLGPCHDVPLPGVWSAVTDENGRYAITDLKRWTPESTRTFDPKTQTGTIVSSCSFHLKHPDYPLTDAQHSAVPQEVNVTLFPPAIVEGQVVDTVTMRPVARAVVSAQGIARSGFYQTHTDERGHYRLVMTRDHYNIWAQADDRIAVAIKALKAEQGQTIAEADIRLVRGGFVVGKIFGADGKPVSSLASTQIIAGDNSPKSVAPQARPISVAHYGPARPRTGAAVTSTRVNPDGSYRLRVAPGQNYIYLMSGDHNSATVTVADGQETILDFHLGSQRQTDFSSRDSDSELRQKLQSEAEQEDKDRAAGRSTPTPKPAVKQRAATPVGKLLDRLDDHLAHQEFLTDPWCQTLKDIVDLGPAAVPELIAELDATNKDMTLRCLGFTLRAINDKRAIPALIRAIPKTLMPPGSDYGANAQDPNLAKFMQQHDLDDRNMAHQYGFGRSLREIFGALNKLSGQTFNEMELNHVFLTGVASQRAAKRRSYWQTARKWSDWWEQHWSEHVQNVAYSQVNLPELNAETIPPPVPNTHFKTAGGISGWVLESVFSQKSNHVFMDLDTGRSSSLPAKWRDSKEVKGQLSDILAWAAQEGFDLFCTEYDSPQDNQRYFALQPIGLKAWELGKNRWQMNSADITLEALQAEGTSAGGLLLHFDSQGKSFAPKETASFLYITREGTPGLLFVGPEVKHGNQKPRDIPGSEEQLRQVLPPEGRRLDFREFEEITFKN